jgi:phage baseplate assembly protein V
MLGNLMRWVRVRGLVEGLIQKGRAEALDDDARDDAQRPQDYGFAALPLDGQGLKLEIGGHTVIIRLDRINDRPQLDAWDVAVWHKEGHMVKLKSGRVIEMVGDHLDVNMAVGVNINAPNVAFQGQQLAFNMSGTTTMTSAGAMNINAAGLSHNGVNIGDDHTHGNVTPGGARTNGPG